MYVASDSDKEWLLNVQRKLYAQSWDNPGYVFRKLWGFVTDDRNLRCALHRVARNKGRQTAGVDGITVGKLFTQGTDTFIAVLKEELRSGSFKPSPARRVLIPKNGKPGEFRPLGIPTVKDRVVQAALKNVLEPVFEADFYPSSFGFRPGKSAHGALEHLRLIMSGRCLKASTKENPRFPYQWAIEGDIKGCFDNISHHGLMTRLRRRIGEGKVNRLILAFLQAGVMKENQFSRTGSGTPQGGILSPLLANVALSVIDERYDRFSWPRFKPTRCDDEQDIKRRARANRANDANKGKPVFVPIRYADDFIILVNATKHIADKEAAEQLVQQEKTALAMLLKKELNLELAEAKTLVTPMTSTLSFLGFRFKVQHHPVWGWTTKLVIPKQRSKHLREHIKVVFKRSTCHQTLENRLRELNATIRGWGQFYRFGWGAKDVFRDIDNYIWHSIYRWLRKKHPTVGMRQLSKRYGYRKPGRSSVKWTDKGVRLFELCSIRVGHYRLVNETRPAFASTSMESPVHNERCTPGSGMRRP
jgi:group II intron reverse transcriptase/maturase